MGSLSALIVSACVAPPLIAALTVISQTGDVVRGGAALFVMSIGMGTPLLLVGASAGKLLPRAGAWMDTVKNLFGVLFLGVAAWMLSRIVPGWASMILWAVPALVLAWVFWNARAKTAPAKNLSRALAVAAGIDGVVLLAGAGLGSTNPLAPIPQLAEKQTHLEFKRFKTVADLEREVAAASPRWKEHYAVRLALVLQPRTPLPLSLLQLSSLLKSDLIRVARTEGLAPLILAAALATVERLAVLRRG